MYTSSLAGVALACVLASAAPSMAQDDPGNSFSGFYFGGNLGAAFNPSDLHFRDDSVPQDLSFSSPSDNDRLLGGLHAGYGGWSGNMYLGAEGDVDWAKRMNYLASVRGRLGFGSDRWLVYGTAGAAFIGGKERFNVLDANDPSTSFSRSRRETGFVGGAGVEYALGPRTTLGVEGLWYDFGSDRRNLTTSAGEPFSVRDDRNFPVVRARFTYYLN